jgi:hypothetical protein
VTAAGRSYWAALHLLDREVLDVHGQSSAKVDDLELTLLDDPGSLPIVSELLCGPAALARRFGGRLGAALETLHQLMDQREHARPASISMGVVTEIGPSVRLSVPQDELQVNAVEQFLSKHVIGHIPGAAAGKPSEESGS